MSIVFPAVALPPEGTLPRPAADVVFYLLLKNHPALAPYGLTVDFAEETSTRTAPWLRLGVVRYLEPYEPGESTPICSVDVYAADHLAAEDIASRIASIWPFLKKVAIPTESAFISGAWVEVEPYRLNEPDLDDAGDRLARYHVEVGLRLHPLPPVTEEDVDG